MQTLQPNFVDNHYTLAQSLMITGYSRETFYKYVRIFGINAASRGYYRKEDIETLRDRVAIYQRSQSPEALTLEDLQKLTRQPGPGVFIELNEGGEFCEAWPIRGRRFAFIPCNEGEEQKLAQRFIQHFETE